MGTNFRTARQLGLYSIFPTLLNPGEPWVEWGIVEHRLHLAQPDLYSTLYEHYGHVTQGSRRYSVSSYLAGRMRYLADHSDVSFIISRGTGRWAYNTAISYWALAPTPARGNKLTWEQYATDQNLSGHWWEIIGRDAP